MSTANNSVTTQTTSFPAWCWPYRRTTRTVLINDQVRQLFYLYNVSGGSSSTFGGMGTAAAWTPDSDTLYIVDSAAQQHGGIAAASQPTRCTSITRAPAGPPILRFCQHQLTGGSQSLAITIPSVGAFLSGSSTVAHTWCPSGTVGNYANMIFYPQGPSAGQFGGCADRCAGCHHRWPAYSWRIDLRQQHYLVRHRSHHPRIELPACRTIDTSNIR